MVTRTVRIPYKYGGVVKIKPLFDVHAGNIASDIAGFKKYLAKDDDEYTYFLGGGDLTDSIITTDIKRYQKSIDATTGDEIIDEQIGEMRRILEPYKSRIIGLGTGNHEDSISRKCGTHPTKRLCAELGVPYHGYSCLLGLTLFAENNPKKCVRLVIRIHHGWGGGSRTRGGSITSFERDMGKWDADIYMFGHVHKKQADRMPRLGLQAGKLVSKPQLLVLCGTYLKTFTDTQESTYSERAGYPPTEIGSPIIVIEPGKTSGYELRADI